MNPIEMMGHGQRAVLATLDRLRPDDWQAIALGVWTTKDLVGHLGAFESRFADTLAVFLDEAPLADLRGASPATFNDDQAAVRASWSVEEVVAELVDAHERVMASARRVSGERWREVGTVPWYGPEYALDDLMVYTVYAHKREHQPQLEAVLDRPDR